MVASHDKLITIYRSVREQKRRGPQLKQGFYCQNIFLPSLPLGCKGYETNITYTSRHFHLVLLFNVILSYRRASSNADPPGTKNQVQDCDAQRLLAESYERNVEVGATTRFNLVVL